MTLNKKHLINLGFILFVLFLVFSFVIYLNISFIETIDYKTTILLQKLIPNFFILPFSTFSILGSAEFMGIALIIILFLFIKYKKIYFLALFVVMGLIEIFGKTFVHQPGPPLYFHKTSLLLGLPTSQISQDFFAYPSGHSSRTAFVSGVLILAIWLNSRLSKEIKILLIGTVLIFDLIMFVSRIYLGEHWASDVVGGALLGFSLAFFTSFFLLSRASKSSSKQINH